MKESIVFKPYDGMAAKVGDVVYSAYAPEGEKAAVPGKVVYTGEAQFIVDWGRPNSLATFTRVTAERHLSYGVEQFLVNGFVVPCPVGEAEDAPEVLSVAAPENYDFCWRLYPGDTRRKLLIRRQLVHKTSFAAVAHAKAMLGIDPWKEASLEDAGNGLNDPGCEGCQFNERENHA